MGEAGNRHEPLFIVDNSAGGRTGLGYLTEWAELASNIDIATGYFEIGALLDLDGQWQKFDKIRILMGDEFTHRTKKALLEAVMQKVHDKLDDSLEDDKNDNPFLKGLAGIVAGMKTGQIECKVFNKDKFHAKAYITHGRFEVIGSQALVGSSNFTRPGLTQNIELNIKIESSAEVAQLQAWYEEHWVQAVDVTDDVVQVLTRHAQEFTPFDVYTSALHAMFDALEPSVNDWELNRSRMFARLDRYQQEGYWAMINIARQHGGALLCDGVGLGKTFIGLMLIERLILQENKRVVLFAPKAVRDSVWIPDLKKYLPHIGGVGGAADFSNLTVFSHTDLTRALDFPERFARITELADAVIIDEAHHFRNTGKRGDDHEPDERSRYYRLFDLIGGNRHKSVYMLTATPINNSLSDYRHLVELFSRGDDSFFAKTLGVPSLVGRLNGITRALKAKVGEDVSEAEVAEQAAELLSGDSIFKGLVVQRSRAYARASQIQETGEATAFPVRDDPKVADYSIRKSYGNLLNLVDVAFQRERPLFSLPMYYPLAYYRGSDASIDPLESNRQAAVVGLIRTNFLKRFESSVYAFELSCDRLLRKLLAFVQVNSPTESEAKRCRRWLQQHAELLDHARQRQLILFGDEEEPDEENEDIIPPELLAKAEWLDPYEYNIPEILAETFLDLDQIATLLDECRRFTPASDDKLKKLIRLLKSRAIDGQKVLIFTEFADTARYLRIELEKAGIQGIAQLDSSSKVNRVEAIRRFAPFYNGTSSAALKESGQPETRVLIATDVLSEGLNLQDATKLINYDIHWNPVRLMQRIGRVDRRLNPEVEAELVKAHPSVAKQRGRVSFWNFLPPEDLDTLLTLYNKVSHKTLLISKTLGIEGKKLLTPDDEYEALKEFNAAYEGETTAQENLHLEYQRLLEENPELESRLLSLPSSIFSGRERTTVGTAGVFLCFRLPALDTESGGFTLEAGVTRWYLHKLPEGELLDHPGAIADAIRSTPETQRQCVASEQSLIDIRDSVIKHIKNGYLKQLNAPVNSPKPALISWMELGETK